MIDWVSHAISAAIAAVIGAFVGRSVDKGKDAKIDKLDSRLTTVEDQRMKAVERRLEKIDDGGCRNGQKVLQQIEHANGMLNKLDLKMDRIAETTAKQAAEIAANNKYVGNLDKSLQRHKETAHHG